MLGPAIKTAIVPVKAVVDGSPVLAKRLLSIGADSRDKALRLRELELQKLRGEWKKFGEQERLAAELAHRKAGRGKRVDAVMSGVVVSVFALMLVGPYLRWVLVAVLAVWSIAAMAHSPKAADQGVADGGAEELPNEEEDADEPTPTLPSRPLTAPELVATIERMVAIRATNDGGAGNVLIGEVLGALQRHHQFEGYDAREFGAAVRAAGVPPKKAVAVGSGPSRKTSPGWSVSHLQATLGRAPTLPHQPAVDRTPVGAA